MAIFFFVERPVRSAQNVLNGEAVARILGDADARGEARNFDIFSETLGNALRNTAGSFRGRSRQNQGEFIAAISSGRIDCSATQVENLRHSAEREAPHDVAVRIVDLF